MKRVKVVAEEAGGFLDWQVLPDYYNHNEEVFPRLKKKMGFGKQEELRQFVRGLYEAI